MALVYPLMALSESDQRRSNESNISEEAGGEKANTNEKKDSIGKGGSVMGSGGLEGEGFGVRKHGNRLVRHGGNMAEDGLAIIGAIIVFPLGIVGLLAFSCIFLLLIYCKLCDSFNAIFRRLGWESKSTTEIRKAVEIKTVREKPKFKKQEEEEEAERLWRNPVFVVPKLPTSPSLTPQKLEGADSGR